MARGADLVSVCGAVGGAVISSGACCTVGLVRQVLICSSRTTLGQHGGSGALVPLGTYSSRPCVVPSRGGCIDSLCAVIAWATVSCWCCQIGDITVSPPCTLQTEAGIGQTQLVAVRTGRTGGLVSSGARGAIKTSGTEKVSRTGVTCNDLLWDTVEASWTGETGVLLS